MSPQTDLNRQKINVQNLSLRPVESTDETFLETVYADSRRAELAMLGWSREQENAFFKMQFQLQNQSYKMQFPGGDWYVIELDDIPIGRLIVARGEQEINLVDVSLLAEFRNRGVGTYLVENLKSESAAAGKCLSLHVLKTNEQARRLYERLGLVVVEDNDMYFSMRWRKT